MGSNNHNIGPYLSFPVPPPNFNPSANQNWKSGHFQSLPSTHRSLAKMINPPPIPDNTVQRPYAMPEAKILATSAPPMKMQKTNTQECLPPQPNTNNLMSRPPPTYPFFPAAPLYSTPMPQQFHSNSYSAGGLPYPSTPVMYSPVVDPYQPNTSSYYTPPPPPPPPPPVVPNGSHLTQNHYTNSSPQSYMRNTYYNRKTDSDTSYYKRRNDSEGDSHRKNNKKRKKPLSQNIPQRKDWSVEEAKRAIEVEKEYNKRNRSQSLIIKFPDADLNRDIVSRLHPAIDNVHFQQPSTPRFCFVTLKENENAEEVIERLNKTRFGQGFLSAEFKKDREDEMNIGPEDIDPLTLYVGNLAQDVIKDDMVKIYPKHKRVDIGYAKKMKYTRYAFVSFKSVDDSIEAFKQTHSTQLYSKSLIVRFRRLHGTVGMPGEPKPQLPQKNDSYNNLSNREEISDSNVHQPEEDVPPWVSVDVSAWVPDQYAVKQEPSDSEDEMEGKSLHSRGDLFDSSFTSDNLEPEIHEETEQFELRELFPKPKKLEVDERVVKNEFPDFFNDNCESETERVKNDRSLNVDVIKNHNNVNNRNTESFENIIKKEPHEKKFSTYKQLILLNSLVRSQPPVQIKKENDLESTCEHKADPHIANLHIKREPFVEDGHSEDEGKETSSVDEVDFNSLLKTFQEQKIKKKKMMDAFM